jgi:hypothetical protein
VPSLLSYPSGASATGGMLRSTRGASRTAASREFIADSSQSRNAPLRTFEGWGGFPETRRSPAPVYDGGWPIADWQVMDGKSRRRTVRWAVGKHLFPDNIGAGGR